MDDIWLSYSALRVTEQRTALRDIAYPSAVHYFPETYKQLMLGLASPPNRLAQALLQEAQVLGLHEDGLDPQRQALILAAGNTVFAGANYRKQQRGGPLDHAYQFQVTHSTQMLAGKLAQGMGCTGHISCDASACASSMKALMDAVHLIRCHGFERVVIVAVEDQVSHGLLEFFGSLGLCLSLEALESGALPSAFDSVNQGFLIGQGAALVVLDSSKAMQQHGRAGHARLLAAVTGGEACNSVVAQDIEGLGFEHVMRWVLQAGQCRAGDIDLVKTHGTGTSLNNQAERSALLRVLGPDFIATAYKPHIGHTFGASGLIESVLAINDARLGFARGIANRSEVDQRFLSADLNIKLGKILALAAGMGNVYGAALWEVVHG